MRKNNCELIRRELDELMLAEECSTAATEHLRECVECREFHEQQTKLRQIVGSLGTVEAPADFYFRLRARLVGEGNGVSSIYFPFARRGLAVAAMLLVFATGAVVVRNVLNQPARVDEMARQPETHQPAANQEQTPAVEVTRNDPEPAVANDIDDETPTIRRGRRTQADYKKRTLSSFAISSERAELYGRARPVGVSTAFPIDASVQSFKVSLDDGRGNAKTISVPTISFGSQRIVQSGSQVAPKRDW
jgi:hypothetical protein